MAFPQASGSVAITKLQIQFFWIAAAEGLGLTLSAEEAAMGMWR